MEQDKTSIRTGAKGMNSTRTFTRMKDHASIVRLATRLGYKVYKENTGYDSDQPALYMVKNGNGVKFTGIVLNAILAKLIKYDMQQHAKPPERTVQYD